MNPNKSLITKSKLMVPKLGADFISRSHLNLKLQSLKTNSVLLVSAPSGYGKTTIVSNFFLNTKLSYCWFSVSDEDNDLSQFLKYFIHSVRGVYPKFGYKILDLIDANQFPEIDLFVSLFTNEFLEFSQDIYLIIDDYHLINNNKIHALFSGIFNYSLNNFKLVLITRMDPPLPLFEWRNKGKLIEIRLKDLKFDENEIESYCIKNIGGIPEKKHLVELNKFCKGWVTGLKLLFLSIGSRSNFYDYLLTLKGIQPVHELILEVLNKQTAFIKLSMLKLSVVDDFNRDIFRLLCLENQNPLEEDELFDKFINYLRVSNLFIVQISYDEERFRFHHLIKEEMFNILKQSESLDSLQELYHKVGNYYIEFNKEMAIQFLIKAEEFDKAILVLDDFRIELISGEKFNRLESVYSLFPKAQQDKNFVLIIVKAWLNLFKGNIPAMAMIVDELENIMKAGINEIYNTDFYEGEINAMKSYVYYLYRVDIDKCMISSKKAISLLSNKSHPYALGVSWIFYGASLQILDSSSLAKKEIYSQFNQEIEPAFKMQLLLILCYIEWFGCNLIELLKIADNLIETGIENKHNMSSAHGYAFKGFAYFQRGNDKLAEKYLVKANELKYFSIPSISFPCELTYAAILGDNGNKKYIKLMDSMRSRSFSPLGSKYIKVVQSYEAFLNWKYTKNLNSLEWAKKNDYTKYLPIISIFSPELYQCRILTTSDSISEVNKSIEILNYLIPVFEARNDLRFIMEAKLIQAVNLFRIGNKKMAYSLLKTSLKLSEPSFFVRPFIEIGDHMKLLLKEFFKECDTETYCGQIIALFKDNSVSKTVELSRRESEILSYFKTNKSNREIADTLYISEKTVKRHISNIYAKLSVHNRSDALKMMV